MCTPGGARRETALGPPILPDTSGALARRCWRIESERVGAAPSTAQRRRILGHMDGLRVLSDQPEVIFRILWMRAARRPADLNREHLQHAAIAMKNGLADSQEAGWRAGCSSSSAQLTCSRQERVKETSWQRQSRRSTG